MKAKIPSGQRPTLRLRKKALSKGYKIIAGVDESGLGPLAGPVLAAAVILGDHRFKNRIDDCKRLTAKARIEAYREILEYSLYCNVAVVSHKVVDRINVHNAGRLAMEKAVIGLGVKPDYVLVDGIIKLSLPCKAENVIKGDRKCVSIACASILAKVRRDRIMDRFHRLYPNYGFMNHRGYGTSMHMKRLRKYGPSPVHRVSFEPVRALVQEKSQH